jgi:iron complex outermembrane receptor protein
VQHKNRLGWVIGAFAPLLLISTIAEAAVSDAVEVVVVEARKRKEDAQSVPLPVSVVSGASLEDRDATQIQALSFVSPSLIVSAPNSRNTSFAIRGLGNNPASDGLSGSVGFYMDGVYLDRPGMAAFDLIDIDHVEILRGPQGTLFGKNTTAGAVTVATRSPDFTYGATGDLRLGSDGFKQLHLSITGPLSDSLAFRLTAYNTDRDGYLQDVYTGERLLSLHRQGLRGQFLFRPSEEFSWRVIGEYGRQQDSSGALILYSKGPTSGAGPTFLSYDAWARNLGITPVFDPNGLINDENSLQRLTERQYAVTSLLTLKLGELSLDSVTGWRDWQYLPHNDQDFTYADAIRDAGIADRERQFSQELRLSGRLEKPDLDYLAGAYIFSRTLRGDSQMQWGSQFSTGLGALGNPAVNNVTSHAYSDISNQAYALFFQGTWHLDPTWNLTAGVRETYESASGVLTRVAPTGGAGPTPLSLAPFQGSIETGEWTSAALATIDHRLSDTAMVYGSLSYGAKAGGFNPIVPADGAGRPLPMSTLKVQPEDITNLELGLKSQLPDHGLVLNANAYWADVGGYQANAAVLLPSGGLQPLLTNVGSTRTQGFEVEASYTPLPDLSLRAALGYNDAHYLSFPNALAVQGSATPTQDLSNRPLVRAPQWMLNVSGSYSHPLSDQLDMFVRGEVNVQSGYYGFIDDSPYSHVSGTAIANLRMGARFQNLEFSLWVENISDARTFTGMFPAPAGSAGYLAGPGLPRMWGLTLRSSLDG